MGKRRNMNMVIMGTRPEIIKLYPIIKKLKPYVVLTGQHDSLANQMIKDFGIKVDENLKVMTENQTLTSLSIKLHKKISELYARKKPELVIVQGDTTSAMVTALEAFYHKIPVAHIEAGLRTDNIYAPFPEEVNRRIITQIATYNFATTQYATLRAKREGWGRTHRVGQTGIDTLLEVIKTIKVKKKKKIFITLHRRENFDKIRSILERIIAFLMTGQGLSWEAVMPVHPNPNVQMAVKDLPIIKFIEPLSYKDAVREMAESSLIITDSGGIQEEAPTLGIPVWIARTATERPEGVEAGFARFLGNNDIYAFKLPKKKNPYGDGKATERILKWLK